MSDPGKWLSGALAGFMGVLVPEERAGEIGASQAGDLNGAAVASGDVCGLYPRSSQIFRGRLQRGSRGQGPREDGAVGAKDLDPRGGLRSRAACKGVIMSPDGAGQAKIAAGELT